MGKKRKGPGGKRGKPSWKNIYKLPKGRGETERPGQRKRRGRERLGEDQVCSMKKGALEKSGKEA